jgi:hypothetical protein
LGDRLTEWLEGLCLRRADGSWLVQVPVLEAKEPVIFALPNDAAKIASLEAAKSVGMSRERGQVVQGLLLSVVIAALPAVPSSELVLGLLVVLGVPLLVGVFGWSLWAIWAGPRREERLLSWFARLGTPVSPEDLALTGQPITIRSRQEIREGWAAARPVWMLGVEWLTFGLLVAVLLPFVLNTDDRCVRVFGGLAALDAAFGGCFSELRLIVLATVCVALVLHYRRLRRLRRLRRWRRWGRRTAHSY